MNQNRIPTEFEMKMQIKQYEAEARRCNKDAVKERKKAKAALRKGDRAAAAIFAKNVIRSERQADGLIKAAAVTTEYSLLLQNANATVKSVEALDTVQSEMEKRLKDIDYEKLAQNRYKLEGLKEKIETANELIKSDEDLVPDADDMLAALEAEILADAMVELSEVPIENKNCISTNCDNKNKK